MSSHVTRERALEIATEVQAGQVRSYVSAAITLAAFLLQTPESQLPQPISTRPMFREPLSSAGIPPRRHREITPPPLEPHTDRMATIADVHSLDIPDPDPTQPAQAAHAIDCDMDEDCTCAPPYCAICEHEHEHCQCP